MRPRRLRARLGRYPRALAPEASARAALRQAQTVSGLGGHVLGEAEDRVAVQEPGVDLRVRRQGQAGHGGEDWCDRAARPQLVDGLDELRALDGPVDHVVVAEAR